jgi:methyl-accepting chemotaxis protein
MKKNGLSYILKWLSIYLAVVILFTMGLFLVVYFEVAGTMAALDLGQGNGAVMSAEKAANAFTGMRFRLVLILSGGVFACAVLGYAWMRLAVGKIGRPVRTISRAMSKLAKGQLNETVAIETSDEFECIGSSINELAANLQELLLHIWKQTGQCLALLENIKNNPDLRHDKQLTLEGLGYLKQLSEAVEGLREMAKAYVFYDVNIEGTKTTAVNHPGEVKHASNLEESPNDLN